MSAQAPSGLDVVGELPWGSHVCQFFRDGADLRETLVPYFKAGLENNERCLLVATAPFGADDARDALRAVVGDFDRREKRGQIEIHDVGAWYDSASVIDGEEIVAGLMRTEQQAQDDGFTGLRTNGNISWVGRHQWNDFQDYETRVTNALRGRRMISMCSYCLDTCSATDVLDVVSRHSHSLGRLREDWSVVATASSAQFSLQDQQSILIRELDHRIKNNLATVQALVGSTIRSSRSMEEFQQSFTGRIAALSRTHSLLTDAQRASVSVRQLLDNELAPYSDGDDRVNLTGPDVVVPAPIAVSFGMAIHELTTNALKHGALSVLGGRLEVDWIQDGRILALQWRELNVPLSAEPQRTGFGTQLLKRLLPVQLGADVAMAFEPDGLKASITMPLGEKI